MIEPRPFQRRFIRGAFASGTDTAALSIPRGNGKSTLAAHILSLAMTPGHRWNRPGREYILLAGSLEQARMVFNPLREALEPMGDWRFIDSITRVGATHIPTRTRLRVLSSNARTAFGVVGCPLLVADEPGAWEVRGGELMYDALATAQGKPGSRLRIVFIGTLAPAQGGWWHDMIRDGSHGSTYVQALQGDPATWDQWPTIRKANPLCNVSPTMRRKLLEERDAARADSRLKARFLSYRLNVPSADESKILLTVDDWERMMAREVPGRRGKPVVGVDLGAGRAWSAATAIWKGGRVEALAVAPGIPSIREQEKRDRVPSGTYRQLVQSGALRVAEGLRVQPPAQLVDAIRQEWGRPKVIVCDRFRLNELRDCSAGIPLEPRVTRWSDAASDIRALRKLARDGPLSVAEGSRLLLAASLSAAVVQSDDAGNTRLVKRGTNNTARDDVAAALLLAAGLHERVAGRPRSTWRYRGSA